LTARRLIVADAGQSWLDDLFTQARRQSLPRYPESPARLTQWLEYKRRSVALQPENWLAFYANDVPVGLAQGARVARVFHTHFLYLCPECQNDGDVESALILLDEYAGRRRCASISFEGIRTTAVLKNLDPGRLVKAGYTWHERVHLELQLDQRPLPASSPSEVDITPLSLKPANVSRLMQLESEAFLHAACDHPGELPLDFSDGYRTTLIPMQATSAMAVDREGCIRGALYAEGKGDAAWIHALFVEPGWRNRGIARVLLEYCLWQHCKAGFDTCELMVLAANIPAVNLYMHAGFEEIRRVDLFIRRI
jgi:GNAT superfamily N-acetyltransferase